LSKPTDDLTQALKELGRSEHNYRYARVWAVMPDVESEKVVTAVQDSRRKNRGIFWVCLGNKLSHYVQGRIRHKLQGILAQGAEIGQGAGKLGPQIAFCLHLDLS